MTKNAMKKILLTLLVVVPFVLKAQMISTIAGDGTPGHLGDAGLATAAEINDPEGIFVDATGNIYITESNGNYIRKINAAGVISTIAGTGVAGYIGDGFAATSAKINAPFAVFVDPAGNVFFSDYNNNVIRKISTSGIISTIAGNGTAGYLGDGLQATVAELNHPTGISFDGAGNLYIGDFSNQRVRKVNTSGVISTFAGNGTPGWTADGVQATATTLWDPNFLHATASGDLYITDNKNHRIRLVKGSTGIITTVAGNGTPGGTGDGGPATAAELDFPGGVDFDATGNMYIPGDLIHNVRVVNTMGIINNYAGSGTAGFLDNVPATAGELHTPVDVAFDHFGNLLIVDQLNNRVRRVGACINTITAQPVNDTVFAGTNAIYAVTTTMLSPTYQWQENPGTGFTDLAEVIPYSGVNTNTLIIHEVNMLYNTTHYRCVISNAMNCPDTSAGPILIIKNNISGVTHINAQSRISIYPNPTSTTLTVNSDCQIDRVTIANILGQTVYDHGFGTRQAQLNVADLASGLYFLKINGGEVRRFVKE